MYEEDMDQSCTDMPLSADGITQAHEDALMRAMQFFEKRAVGKKAKEYILRLEKEMMKILNEYKELNYLESKELCTHLAETLFNLKLRALVNQEDTSYRQNGFMSTFKREWEVFSASYDGTPNKGPMAAEVLANFYLNSFMDFTGVFSVKLKDSFGKEIRQLQGENRDLSSALSIVTSERNVIMSNNEELQLKVEELGNINHHLISRVDQQDASIVELTDKLRAVARSDDESKDRLDRAENKVASMKAREKENERLAQELDAYRTGFVEKDLEIKQLKERIEAQNRELANLALVNRSSGGGKKKSGWSCVP